MVDGQRYTCEKCKKGHRTGTCTHLVDDHGQPSLLQKTNRAGRPNTGSVCSCPSKDKCKCVKTWFIIVRIPKSEIEPGKENQNNCRIIETVTRPLREANSASTSFGGSLVAASQNDPGHECNCGDKCACTYCPTHPENEATQKHNQILANQNRSADSVANPTQHIIEASAAGCAGPAEVSYASFSANTEFGQQEMLAGIPLNDHKNHYQIYSGQYFHASCPSVCRCHGCYTWRVAEPVKRALALSGGYQYKDCVTDCHCAGCLSYRASGGVVEHPILTIEEFFDPTPPPLPPAVTSPTSASLASPMASLSHLDVYRSAIPAIPTPALSPTSPVMPIAADNPYLPHRFSYPLAPHPTASPPHVMSPPQHAISSPQHAMSPPQHPMLPPQLAQYPLLDDYDATMVSTGPGVYWPAQSSSFS